MIGGVPWPDVLFVAVLGLAAFKGFTRGFVKELGGMVAAAAALIAPWYYNGNADGWIARSTDLGAPFAHAIGMVLTGLVAYAVVMAIVWIVGSVVKLPVLGAGNKVAGAIVGFIKGYVFLWAVLYIALFFPLTPGIRKSLHESYVAPYLTAYDPAIDQLALHEVPPFARPYLQPYFNIHHV